ncbi:MAG TPA: isochorismatase family protein [Pseudolabrys sp.]|nr:isochorismatase family protein [Pseudolabrys sp.]
MTVDRREGKSKVLSFDDRVDPASTALVVIDVQNDFALPQGVCGQVGDDISPVAPMVRRLKQLIDAARTANVLVVFVRTIYDEPVLSHALAEQYLRRGYPNSICLSGTPGAEFYDGLGPRDAPNEVLITKHRYSAFWGSSIDLVLRSNAIRTVVLAGIATEVCVESTARDAFFKDYQVVVASDCVGSYSEERQKASLTVIARSFGIVSSHTDIAAVWRRRANGTRNWQPAARAERALTTQASRLRPVHTALLLINVQRNFFGDEGALAQKKLNTALIAALPRLRRLLDEARNAGCLVIHARSLRGGQDGIGTAPALSEIDVCGSRGAELMDGFGPIGDEQVVTCQRSSGFADTQLDVLLRSNAIRTVVVAGATTNGAIETTAREASDRDYHVIVCEDGVAALDSETDLHKASLTNTARYFGEVASSETIIAHWRTDCATTDNQLAAQAP